MAAIQAFHGIRYDLGHVGSLSDVVAPPYDVIDHALQTSLYERHPANAVRLILNRDEPGDDDRTNRYSRAGRFFRNWQREGVLKPDAQAAIYAYQQTFEHDGQSFTRGGFMARVRLERFGEGNIFPHEETHSAAKADRLKLISECRANMSQIFGLFPDEENRARTLLDRATQGQTPLEATDHLHVVHRLWPVTSVETITELTAILGPKPVFIADGHHRYETALNYRDALASQQDLPPDHPAHYVLMMCVGMSDPGMIVLPTHRLFRGLEGVTYERLAGCLEGCFQVTEAGSGVQAAGPIWEEIEIEGQQGTLGFYVADEDRWLVARVTEQGHQRMEQVAPDRSKHWRQLGVSLLHRLVMDELLGQPQLPSPMYVHDVKELVSRLEQGDTAGRDATGQHGAGGKFGVAALVMPATLDHVRAISESGERMPAKSTYFYPKLLSGLVFNPLE